MKLRQRLVPWLLAFCLCGCVALPDVAPNVCGNGVWEPNSGEDCDGYANAEEGQRCRGPEAKQGGACHYDCSAGYKCPKDMDMSCGLDELCHRGSRQYEPWGKFLPQQAHALQLGDLDGDGRADLLALGKPSSQWQSVPTVVFFDEKGNPQGQPFSLPTGIRAPVLAPIVKTSERPQQQIVAGTGFGIATLMSNAERQFSSLPYPYRTFPTNSANRMIRAYGVTDSRLNESVLIYLSAGGQNTLSDATTNILLGTFEHSVADLGGPPVAGNLDDRPSSPCDELVLTYATSGNVDMHKFCDSAGHLVPSTAIPQTIATLPVGHTAASEVMLARVDGDEHLDLILKDNLGCPYVSFGLGDGTFAANPAYAALTSGQLWPVVTESSACPEYPLAIADLKGDGWPDWVLPTGIAMVHPLGIGFDDARVRLDTYPSNTPSVENWTIARVGEFTGDSCLDLIAGSSNGADLDFFLGTGQDSLNPALVQTDGPVQYMVTGDYDGDRIDDIALIQARPVTVTSLSASSDGLAIAYGRRDGVPTTPTDIAGFSSVEQLLSANYQTDDDTEELAVLSKSTASAASQLTLFVGNLGRFPISSLGLWKVATDPQQSTVTPVKSNVGGAPIASTAGRFADSTHWSFLALAKDDCDTEDCANSYRLWFAPSANGSAPDVPSDVITAPEFIPLRKTDGELSVYFVVGNIEAIATTSNALPDDALLLTAGPDENQVSLWRITLPLTASPLTWLSACPGRLTPTSSPMLVDLNKDDFLDLVLLLADPDPTIERLRLAIVWNSKDNHSLDLGQAEFVDGIFSTVRGLAPNGSQGLFVATESGTYRVEWDKQNAKLTSTMLTFHDPSLGLPGGGAIAVGDMTGDGLADLALSVAGGISLYAQEQAKP